MGPPKRANLTDCQQLEELLMSRVMSSRSLVRLKHQQARQDSNLQPPVLETGALPIELRAYATQLPFPTSEK